MKVAVAVVVAAALVAAVSAFSGVDISSSISVGTVQCLKQNGYEFMIIRVR